MLLSFFIFQYLFRWTGEGTYAPEGSLENRDISQIAKSWLRFIGWGKIDGTELANAVEASQVGELKSLLLAFGPSPSEQSRLLIVE